jgi:hypothetical protein
LSTFVVLDELLDEVLLVLLVLLVVLLPDEVLSAKQTGTIISNRMMENIPSFTFIISPECMSHHFPCHDRYIHSIPTGEL